MKNHTLPITFSCAKLALTIAMNHQKKLANFRKKSCYHKAGHTKRYIELETTLEALQDFRDGIASEKQINRLRRSLPQILRVTNIEITDNPEMYEDENFEFETEP